MVSAWPPAAHICDERRLRTGRNGIPKRGQKVHFGAVASSESSERPLPVLGVPRDG